MKASLTLFFAALWSIVSFAQDCGCTANPCICNYNVKLPANNVLEVDKTVEDVESDVAVEQLEHHGCSMPVEQPKLLCSRCFVPETPAVERNQVKPQVQVSELSVKEEMQSVRKVQPVAEAVQVRGNRATDALNCGLPRVWRCGTRAMVDNAIAQPEPTVQQETEAEPEEERNEKIVQKEVYHPRANGEIIICNWPPRQVQIPVEVVEPLQIEIEEPVEQKTSEPVLHFAPIALDVTAFPNPAREQFTVRVTGIEDAPCTIQLFDVSGKMVREVERFNGLQQTFSRENLGAGVYIYKVSVADNSQLVGTGRLVIE